MGLFSKKNPDPIGERERKLKAEIAALESQIKQISSGEAPAAKPQPRLRSTWVPEGNAGRLDYPQTPKEPIFEDVDHARVHNPLEHENTPQHYNDVGVRKYELLAVWKRFISLFKPAAPSNPKLVSLLAAGNIKGLRPLRREKRIARNRVILLAVVLFSALYIIVRMLLKSF